MRNAFRMDLFGMPLVMAKDDVDHAQRILVRAWELQMGRQVSDFPADLDALEGWFHPKLRGATLRKRLLDLGQLDVTGTQRLPPVALLPCGDERFLVTPEGRAWLDCSRTPTGKADGRLVFQAELAEPFEQQILSVYRRWTRHRIEDVIQKRTGEGPPMLPTAIAIVLLLLVNRSLSPETAIKRVRDPQVQARIDNVIADVIGAFADALSGPSNRRNPEQFSLWSGYPLTEARRRLPGQLVLDEAQGGSVYVDGDQEGDVVEFLARDLARRRAVSDEEIDAAFEALVSAYRRRLQDLSGLGSGFERVGKTDALRTRLADAIRSVR
jgi:hypothetical protein